MLQRHQPIFPPHNLLGSEQAALLDSGAATERTSKVCLARSRDAQNNTWPTAHHLSFEETSARLLMK
ncbi:hypothetical protein MHYP_G00075460 [Metynnis hypsauchen]